MNIPLKKFFHASVIAPETLTQEDITGFKILCERAEMMGAPYLKPKTVQDLHNGAFLVSVKSANGLQAGQCLLTDAQNEKATYAKAYPLKGKTLILSSLFMVSGHKTAQGIIPPGMGPTSTLFQTVENFAVQNNYGTIIAKTNALNKSGRNLFERMEFTPSSPFMADNEDYTSILYVKDVSPVAP